jgi:hypothetical protein
MTRLLIGLFAVCHVQQSCAQFSQTVWDNWIFGSQNGFSFAGGACSALAPGSVPNAVGAISISLSHRTNGSLSFYGGINQTGVFYNAMHTPFPTPITFCPLCDPGTNYYALICERPGTEDEFYFIYLYLGDISLGLDLVLAHATIDLSANGGQGDVISFGDTILSGGGWYTLIPSLSPDTIYLFASEPSGGMYRFNITNTGFSAGQLIDLDAPYVSYVQNMTKGDRSGTRLARITPDAQQLILNRIDRSAGTFFDKLTLTPQFNGPSVIRAFEFSPNGRFLYCPLPEFQGSSPYPGRLIAFDLANWNIADIGSSQAEIAAPDTLLRAAAGLQLAPDDLIYTLAGTDTSTAVGRLVNPDLGWPFCQLQYASVPLTTGASIGSLQQFPGIWWPDPLLYTTTWAEEGQQQLPHVSPNPAQDFVTVVLPVAWQLIGGSYRWLDALGRVLRQGPLAGGPQQRLEREGLAPGSYLLELRDTEGQLRTARVVWE